MSKLVVNGGRRLSGEIFVSGSKNAALPIIFATVVTGGVSYIENLPDIGDVRVALEIIKEFGASVSRCGNVTRIDTENLLFVTPNPYSVSKIRASTYLIGASLSRFGKCVLARFGGCNFSERPIDLHIFAAGILGASVQGDLLVAKRLCGGEIVFLKPSVGATVNAILLSVSAFGETVIRGGAKEPHIDSLIDFLISAGAEIYRSDDEIRIVGKPLHGGKIKIDGDVIEAGSYLFLGLMTDGEITVKGCPASQSAALVDFLSRLGARISVSDESIAVSRGSEMSYTDIVAMPYPGFPTDLQPLAASLLAAFEGGTITDNVWNLRFGYLDALSDFGVGSSVEGNRALISGSSFCPACVKAPDLRGGMACILAALCANGESVIASSDIVERGYEKICEKLMSVGACIKKVDG